jgi:hypothetical protein
MMTSRITSDVTAGQKKQYDRFVVDAADKALIAASINRDGLQQLLERGGEFQEHIIRGVKEYSRNDQFTTEQVASNYGYPTGFRPGDLDDQIEELNKLFPDLGRPNLGLLKQIKEGKMNLPDGADGWFAIPHWSKVAKSYSEAVEKVCDLLIKAHNGKFNKFLTDQLGSEYLLESTKKFDAMKKLQESQNGGTILFPVQSGYRYRGRSVRNAGVRMSKNEFGLGFYEIAILLLTHLNRLKERHDLWIVGAGDIYSPFGDKKYPCALQFDFQAGWLGINSRPINSPEAHAGIASAFTW